MAPRCGEGAASIEHLRARIVKGGADVARCGPASRVATLDHMDDDVAEVVERVVARHPGWADAAEASNWCSNASTELVFEFLEHGIDATRLWLVSPRSRQRRAGAGATGPREHCVVLVRGAVVVDLTRRQFDPGADFPTVYESLNQVGRDWNYYYDDGEERRHQVALAPPTARRE